MSFFAKESTTLQFASDYVGVNWYPPGTYIVEQGEVGNTLYLILSGTVEIMQEDEEGQCRSLRRQVAGQFFGELALAYSQPRTAHVIAVDSVTCLALSRQQRSVWDGRGMDAQILGASTAGGGERMMQPTTCVDVSDYVDAKMAAIAAHRTQYPMRPDMFPRPLLVKMLGREYFIRVYPAVELETELYPFLDSTSDEVAMAAGIG
jgi:hypothetical protein